MHNGNAWRFDTVFRCEQKAQATASTRHQAGQESWLRCPGTGSRVPHLTPTKSQFGIYSMFEQVPQDEISAL